MVMGRQAGRVRLFQSTPARGMGGGKGGKGRKRVSSVRLAVLFCSVLFCLVMLFCSVRLVVVLLC